VKKKEKKAPGALEESKLKELQEEEEEEEVNIA